MFNLEEEVLHHVARQVQPAIADQTNDDEVAVPAIHLVETAAGHNIAVGQEQQPVRPDGFDLRLTGVTDQHRQMLDAHVARLLQLLDRVGLGEINR